MLDEVREVVHRRDGDIRRCEAQLRLLLTEVAEQRFDERLELVAVPHSLLVGAEPGILGELRAVENPQAVAAPLCTRHLADLGGDVVKIERPGDGDLARGYDSVVRGQSAYFVWANRGKRSVALDLRDQGDHAVLVALLDRADVFVHNLGRGAVARLGVQKRRHCWSDCTARLISRPSPTA